MRNCNLISSYFKLLRHSNHPSRLAPIYCSPLSIVLRRITKIVGNEYEVSCKLTRFILPVLFCRLFSLRFFLKANYPRSVWSRRVTVSVMSIHFFRSFFRSLECTERKLQNQSRLTVMKNSSHFYCTHDNSFDILSFYNKSELDVENNRQYAPTRYLSNN